MEKQRERQCEKCRKSLPATSEFFGPSAGSADGLMSTCRLCLGGKNASSGTKNEDQKADRDLQDKSQVLKKCTDCGDLKPSDEDHFNRHAMTRDGLAHICKTCTGRRVLEGQRKSSGQMIKVAWQCLDKKQIPTGDNLIVLDFSNHLPHYQKLCEVAAQELRTPENQALFFLISGFESMTGFKDRQAPNV